MMFDGNPKESDLEYSIVTKAETLLKNRGIFNINEFSKTHEPVDTNSEVHEFLQDEMVSFKEICNQDTYIFRDGSYITRLEDEYFYGDDVDMFELNEENN